MRARMLLRAAWLNVVALPGATLALLPFVLGSRSSRRGRGTSLDRDAEPLPESTETDPGPDADATALTERTAP